MKRTQGRNSVMLQSW